MANEQVPQEARSRTLFNVVAGIFVVSILTAVAATLIKSPIQPRWLIMPAAVLAALVFIGHLVTLDDDSPSGWSNPGESKEVWHDSLRQLALKFAVFVAVATFLVWSW